MCETVETTSDLSYENNEVISLTLTSTKQNIITSGSSTQVEIIDNNGKP